MMRHISLMAILVLLLVSGTLAQDKDEVSLWLGSHYTDYSDYRQKVGEFSLAQEDWLPEFKLNYLSHQEGSLLQLAGHYFDDQNIFGRLNSRIGQNFSGAFQYRSLTNQNGQDLLSNFGTREWLGTKPGGKIVTSDLLDGHSAYATHRQELQSNVNLLISRTNNIRLIAAHRSVLEKGTEQRLQVDHCSSCHITSETANVDRRTHQVEAGLQGAVGKSTLGYTVSYRQYDPRQASMYGYFQDARHPVTGLMQQEFGSRVSYSDTSLPYGVEPRSEKIGHKVRMNGQLGGGRLSGSVGYNSVTNHNTELSTNAWVGSLSYNRQLSRKTRMIARVAGVRQRSDDPFIDLPDFRAGAANGPVLNFDWTRYSSLDRLDGRASLELISRLTSKATVSATAGWNRIDRYDYEDFAGNNVTNKIFGQAKVRYRKSSRMSTSLSYRFEKISDPFTSSRGLFEASGREVLKTLDSTAPVMPLVFYSQREDLRYQQITTLPTDVHSFDLGATFVPSVKTNIQLSLRGTYDKNGDLDSLDVKHFALQPNITLSLLPSPKWAMNVGYNFSHNTSRLPVSIAMFDG